VAVHDVQHRIARLDPANPRAVARAALQRFTGVMNKAKFEAAGRVETWAVATGQLSHQD
jgi:hypothetical protein